MSDESSSRGGYRLNAAREYLGGMSAITVRRLVQRGKLHPNPNVRFLLFSKKELDRFLSQEKRGPRKPKHKRKT